MRRLLPLVAIALLAAACSSTADAPPDEIVLVTHDSFAVSEEVLDAMQTAVGLPVRILQAGDAGTMVNQAILTKDNPLGDVLFGIDNTFLSRALAADLFLEYRSPLLDTVSDDLELDPHVTPVDFGDVCLNYDREVLGDISPSLRDLTEAAFEGQLVVQNPATSSPGLAFLMATIVEFGEDGDYTWRDYWSDLRDNDVRVDAGWEQAYYGSFSGGAGEGDRPLVVSYASSPPAEVIFGDPTAPAPTGVIEAGCFRQIEFAGILTGSNGGEYAEALIDFLLSETFQEDIPLTMFVFPANQNATLPPEFIEHTAIPESPALLDPAAIDANRERWIAEWTETVTR
ncbi:MAG: thiamine ABC transporter substrate-binding protein [Acidimicrobiia bacterium]|nr:thiamine ABC transporter substrate-binding protein [Acidimicrobiia bacterium]NNC75313.1 thiamine ABC transporter substrate-binding protein [Acidimicrobiia bacterium]